MIRSPKNILITGGAGFIGSHLAKSLIERGDQVVLVDRMNSKNAALKQARLDNLLLAGSFEFQALELEDFDTVESIFTNRKFDCIVHLAAETSLEFNTELYKKRNILGTLTIFELAKRHLVPKVVFASSSMVYGSNIELPFREDQDTSRPRSLYAATKKYDEVLAYTYHYLHKINMVGLRFFTTFGPWSRPDMAINKFGEKILRDEPITIQGDGTTKRDFNFIGDTVSAITAAIDAPLKYEIINVGSGRSTDLNTIIALLEKHIGREAKKEYIPMFAGDLPETWADISKAKTLLGYEPKTSIDEGLKLFVDWLKNHQL